MNKYIFLVVISKEKSKTNQDQDLCGKIRKCKSAQRRSQDENENLAVLSSSTRRNQHT